MIYRMVDIESDHNFDDFVFCIVIMSGKGSDNRFRSEDRSEPQKYAADYVYCRSQCCPLLEEPESFERECRKCCESTTYSDFEEQDHARIYILASLHRESDKTYKK